MTAKTVTPQMVAATAALRDRIHDAWHRYNGASASCGRCDRFPPKDLTPWVAGRAA